MAYITNISKSQMIVLNAILRTKDESEEGGDLRSAILMNLIKKTGYSSFDINCFDRLSKAGGGAFVKKEEVIDQLKQLEALEAREKSIDYSAFKAFLTKIEATQSEWSFVFFD